MKLIFYLLTNVEDFFKLLLSFQVCVARHVQTTEDNKFAISLQYVKKEVSDAVDFLHTDKHETLVHKLIIRFFDGYGQAFAKFQKKQVCNVFTISLKKLEIKLTFLMQINIKVS